jgi:preflagellin peptidase FlaK
MQKIEEGQLKFAYFPKEGDDHKAMLETLEKAGVMRVWVTPKIPFLIFITAGLIMSAIIGNLVLLFAV